MRNGEQRPRPNLLERVATVGPSPAAVEASAARLDFLTALWWRGYWGQRVGLALNVQAERKKAG
jgi:hypothetical protein